MRDGDGTMLGRHYLSCIRLNSHPFPRRSASKVISAARESPSVAAPTPLMDEASAPRLARVEPANGLLAPNAYRERAPCCYHGDVE